MLKRTKSYLLLTMVVLTGFAGSIDVGSLSPKERRVLVSQLKDSKKSILETLEGLNENQVNFKPSADLPSIRENIEQLTRYENAILKMTQNRLNHPINIEERKSLTVSDEQLVQFLFNKQHPCNLEKAGNKKMDEAINEFKTGRSVILKFVRTTTDDLRNSVVRIDKMPVDSYQAMLLLSSHANYHLLEIQKIKNHPNFPK